MTDIVVRLRNTGCDREPFTPEHKHCKCRIANEAANEIDLLRGLLRRADDVTAWETVPHLGYAFQDEVEAALRITKR